MGEKPAIGFGDAFAQVDLRLPAHVAQARDIHQLAGRAVGLGRVAADFTPEPRHLSHHLSQLQNTDIGPRAYIDVTEHRLGVCLIGRPVELHHEERRRGHVVDMQEFAPRSASAPDHHLRSTRCGRLVESADERGQDMAVFGVKIVARPVEVRGHHTAVIGAVLPVPSPPGTVRDLPKRVFGNYRNPQAKPGPLGYNRSIAQSLPAFILHFIIFLQYIVIIL